MSAHAAGDTRPLNVSGLRYTHVATLTGLKPGGTYVYQVDGDSYGSFLALFWDSSPTVNSSVPPRMRRVTGSTWCPCPCDADWCFQSDVTTNSRLQGHVPVYFPATGMSTTGETGRRGDGETGHFVMSLCGASKGAVDGDSRKATSSGNANRAAPGSARDCRRTV